MHKENHIDREVIKVFVLIQVFIYKRLEPLIFYIKNGIYREWIACQKSQLLSNCI